MSSTVFEEASGSVEAFGSEEASSLQRAISPSTSVHSASYQKADCADSIIVPLTDVPTLVTNQHN